MKTFRYFIFRCNNCGSAWEFKTEIDLTEEGVYELQKLCDDCNSSDIKAIGFIQSRRNKQR